MSQPPAGKPPLKKIDPNALNRSDTFKTKVVVVGDGGVGKTALLHNIQTGRFMSEYKPTLGAQMTIRKIFEVFKDQADISFWDFSGQERFAFMRTAQLRSGQSWYSGATAALLVYDSTNHATFEHLTSWFNELKGYADLKPSQVILVGNKADLPAQVTDAELMGYAKQNNVLLAFKTSAKTGDNVSPAFYALAHYAVMNQKLRDGKKFPEQAYKIKIKAIYDTVLGEEGVSKYTSLI